MNSKNFNEVEKYPTNLTNSEKSLIMGTLLGDGHLNKRGNSYRLKIEHSSDQKDLVDWKYNHLKRLCATTRPPTLKTDKRGNKSFLFYTGGSLLLEEMDSLFYELRGERHVKVIRRELIDQLPLDPLLLAVWYMDDGSARNDVYSGRLATQGFTLEEHHLLKEYLLKMNINTAIVKHTKGKKQYYYLSIPASSFQTFIGLVEPHIREVPSMIYKLNQNRKSKSKFEN